MSATFAHRKTLAAGYARGRHGGVPAWTPAQDDLLANLWGTQPDADVARRLGRTVNACKIRATRRLGLARKDNFFTARQVADIFGMDCKQAVRWQEWGYLHGQRSSVAVGRHVAWRFDAEDIERFIRRCPWAYDRSRIERGSYWRNLADQVWAADPWLTLDETAAALGVTRHTVARHLQRGWLPGVRARRVGKGGQWFVRAADLGRFEQRRDSVLVIGSCADQNRRKQGTALMGELP